ncbi:hypothetical protein F7725_010584 [Dissostichus mawsoni]|uniref:Uncharacterized protein n=1 Tax=Dissostichus mawsoni TaxID=36200 RepID=A0A7J5XNV2_DISMA|nr:hypothetical protein F7725_010584 [Dissostichus mawsoni]
MSSQRRGSLLNKKKSVESFSSGWSMTSASTSTKSMAPSTDCQARGASSDVETLIRDIWAGGRKETLWAKYGPYKIYSENLLVFAPGKELEGEKMGSKDTGVFIDCECLSIMDWAKAGVLIVDSYMMTSLWQGTHTGGLRKVSRVGLEISVYMNICMYKYLSVGLVKT